MGRPVKNAIIHISGTQEDTAVTNADGSFVISGIQRNGQYTITAGKNENPSNGLNVLDLVATQKHLLGKDTFDLEWKKVAADATNNKVLSVSDILVVLQLLLGKITVFPFSPSWRCEPHEIFLDELPGNGPVEVQFTAIKIGDVNGTADPQK